MNRVGNRHPLIWNYAPGIEKPVRDSKKIPPNATLTDPITGEVTDVSVRSIGKIGIKGKINYVTIKRVNLNSWLFDRNLISEDTRSRGVNKPYKNYPMILEVKTFDSFTPDYFENGQNSIILLRFLSWYTQNMSQKVIHTAMVDPLRFSELVEIRRDNENI